MRESALRPTRHLAVIVNEGDTLSIIAQRVLGSARKWPILAAVNHLTDPDLILPGDLIVIGGPDPLPFRPRRATW